MIQFVAILSVLLFAQGLSAQIQKPHLKMDVGFPIPAHGLAVWPKDHVKNTKPAHLQLITIFLSCLIYLNVNILFTSAKNKALIRYMEWWVLKKLFEDLGITSFPIPWVMVEIPIFVTYNFDALRSKI